MKYSDGTTFIMNRRGKKDLNQHKSFEEKKMVRGSNPATQKKGEEVVECRGKDRTLESGD